MGAHVVALAGSSLMRSLVLCGLLAALGVGCDQNCQSTCGRVYDASECGVTVSGVSSNRLRDDCVEACEEALLKTGEMGTYNPYQRANPVNPPELRNERQAAEWMNCVWSSECTEIEPSEGGLCAPI
jgi:hypothetical protein